MRSNPRDFVLRTWIAVLIIAASCLAQAQSQTATITGTVTDTTGAVIPNAAVSLESTEKAAQRTDTDEHGLFAIKSKPGDYIFRVAAQGFFTYDIAIHLNDSAVIQKHILLNVGFCSPCVTVLDSSGRPIAPRATVPHNTAALSGTIVDASGASIPTAIVELDANEKHVLWITVNEAGHFTANVPPGNYIQKVTANGFATYSEPIHLIEDTSVRKDIVLQIDPLATCTVCFTPNPLVQTLDASLKSILPFNRLPPLKLHRRADR